jgi:hypothetical protein
MPCVPARIKAATVELPHHTNQWKDLLKVCVFFFSLISLDLIALALLIFGAQAFDQYGDGSKAGFSDWIRLFLATQNLQYKCSAEGFNLFLKQAPAASSKLFYSATLPFVIKLVKDLPSLFPDDKPLHLLARQQSGGIDLTRFVAVCCSVTLKLSPCAVLPQSPVCEPRRQRLLVHAAVSPLVSRKLSFVLACEVDATRALHLLLAPVWRTTR